MRPSRGTSRFVHLDGEWATAARLAMELTTRRGGGVRVRALRRLPQSTVVNVPLAWDAIDAPMFGVGWCTWESWPLRLGRLTVTTSKRGLLLPPERPWFTLRWTTDDALLGK